MLRAAEPEDLDLMYLVENDTALWTVGSSNVPYSRYALRQFIEQTSNDINSDGQVRLVIALNENRNAIGFVDLQNYDVRHRRAEVGIVLLPEWQLPVPVIITEITAEAKIGRASCRERV